MGTATWNNDVNDGSCDDDGMGHLVVVTPIGFEDRNAIAWLSMEYVFLLVCTENNPR